MRLHESFTLTVNGLRERLEVEIGDRLVMRLLRRDELLKKSLEVRARGQDRGGDGP